jgi:hypothetical protein
MTLSAVSNATLAKNTSTQQAPGAGAEQAESRKDRLSSGHSGSEQKFDDNVTLSQSEKAAAPGKVIDADGVEKILPRTMKAILADSRTALAAQANTSPQKAQELLAAK